MRFTKAFRAVTTPLAAAATLAVLAFAGAGVVHAQSAPGMDIAEPFKVGTFEIGGEARLGLVLRDALVVDIAAANPQLERDPAYPSLPMPADMVDLIGRYEYGVKPRLYEIVNHLSANGMIDGAARPAFIHDVGDVRTLPPIMYPGKIMNAAVNFYSHVNETGTPEERAEARRQRRENRGVPYLFLKPSRGAVIGNGDAVVIPWGRDRIDWEVELGAVIGRPPSTSPRPRPRTTCSAIRSRSTSPTAAAVRRAATRSRRTGSWARATTPSRRWAPGSFRRSSTATRWKTCARR